MCNAQKVAFTFPTRKRVRNGQFSFFCLFLKKAYQARKFGKKISLIGFLVNFFERFEDELKIQFDFGIGAKLQIPHNKFK